MRRRIQLSFVDHRHYHPRLRRCSRRRRAVARAAAQPAAAVTLAAATLAAAAYAALSTDDPTLPYYSLCPRPILP